MRSFRHLFAILLVSLSLSFYGYQNLTRLNMKVKSLESMVKKVGLDIQINVIVMAYQYFCYIIISSPLALIFSQIGLLQFLSFLIIFSLNTYSYFEKNPINELTMPYFLSRHAEFEKILLRLSLGLSFLALNNIRTDLIQYTKKINQKQKED